MKQLLLQSLLFSIFFAKIFFVQAVRSNRTAKNNQFYGDRSTYCGGDFTWKGDGSKLIEDCDILKDYVKILLNEMTERTECIEFVDLAIDDEQSPRWNKNEHPYPANQWILMANPVSDRRRKGKRLVTVTARNPNIAEKDKQMSFYVEAEKCSNFEGTDVNEEATEKPGDHERGATTTIICSVTISVTFLISAAAIYFGKSSTKN